MVLLAKHSRRRPILGLSLLVILEVNFPFKYRVVPRVKEFPPEQIWLKDNFVGAPIIQFPIYGWFDPSTSSGVVLDGVGLETLRMYYSTIHWHPMVNGYSGFSPKEWEEKVRWLQVAFPGIKAIAYLRTLGVKLVLVPTSWDIAPVQDELELVAEFPQTKIYALRDHYN